MENQYVLSIIQFVIPVVLSGIAGIVVAKVTSKKKPQDLLSEDIEENIKIDGTRIKKIKKRYK